MRFFTLEFYRSEIDEAGARQVFGRYSQHLEHMKGVLPEEVIALGRLGGVDDGLVVSVCRDVSHGKLRLIMRCGDLQMGYYDLALEYEDVGILPEHDQTLAWIARTTKTDGRHACDVAYHEVDQASNGQIEHRILFHPGVWFAVRCRILRWQRIERPNRSIPRLRDRYPGGPP